MENAKKLHLWCTDINSSMRLTVYAECIYVLKKIKIWSLSLNVMLIVDTHCSDVCCDEFPQPQTDTAHKIH